MRAGMRTASASILLSLHMKTLHVARPTGCSSRSPSPAAALLHQLWLVDCHLPPPHPRPTPELRLALCRSARSVVATAAATPPESPPESSQPKYCIVNFYHLADIERPHAVISQHLAFLEGRDLRGRIYISEQGINAQYGGAREDAVAYADWLATTQPAFAGLRYSVHPAAGHMFPKLRLKYRPNLISLAGGMQGLPVTDPAARATPVAPAQWQAMLERGVGGKRPLLLDVRNGYEWDAGHFAGAERPSEAQFNETPTEACNTPAQVPAPLAAADPDTPVMMYCTGGIRCDVYSTYLKSKGYRNLYTLEGGVQAYMALQGLAHWDGSLFVFDGRMAIRPDKGAEAPLQAAAPCHTCGGTAALPHANCANIDCNKLFIACDECRARLKGCCCEACIDAPRLLRPVITRGLYGNWTEYAGEEEGKAVEATMASGRSERRMSRRRKRLKDLGDRGLAKRSLKMERRKRAEDVLAARGTSEGGAASEGAERLARMARLRELRQRLQVAGKS